MLTAELLLADRNNQARSREFEVYEYSHWFPLVRLVYMQRLRMCLGFLGQCGRALDVGYGDGIILKSLAAISGEVYGIDVHDSGHLVGEMLKKEGLGGRVFLKKASATDIPFADNFFDATICISVLEHIRNTDRAVKELARVTRDGGTLVVGLPIEGTLTRAAWKIFLGCEAEEHVAERGRIKEALGKRFRLAGAKKLPFGFAPDSIGLYEALLYRK